MNTRPIVYKSAFAFSLTLAVAGIISSNYNNGGYCYISFSETYPFFCYLGLLSVLFHICYSSNPRRFLSKIVYGLTWIILIMGVLILAWLAIFINPINSKDFSDFVEGDNLWLLVSNAGIVVVGLVLLVGFGRELKIAFNAGVFHECCEKRQTEDM